MRKHWTRARPSRAGHGEEQSSVSGMDSMYMLIGQTAGRPAGRPRKIYGWQTQMLKPGWEHFKFMIRKSDCFIVCEMDRWSGHSSGVWACNWFESYWIGFVLVLRTNSFIFMICELGFMMMLFVVGHTIWPNYYIFTGWLKVWICHFIWELVKT